MDNRKPQFSDVNPYINDRDYTEFEKYFFDTSHDTMYIIWHDGFDVTILTGLNDEKKRYAKQKLIDALINNQCDYRVIEGLRALGAKEILPVLREIRDNSNRQTKISVCKAIFSFTGDREDEKYLYNIFIEILKNDKSYYERLTAAMELRNFKVKDVIEALYNGVKDVNYLVRNHSSNSLLIINGIDIEISTLPEIFKKICVINKLEDKLSENEPQLEYNEALQHYEEAIILLKELFKKNKP